MQSHSNIQNSDHRSQAQSHSQPHSQQMTSGWTDTVRERPIATAAAVGGAVAAGAFLWSQRNRIGDQVSNMSDQVSQWSGKMRGQQDSSSSQMSDSSASQMSGRSGTPMGVETGRQPELAGAGTASTSSSPRAVGGRSGKAQSGQTMSPSRTASPTPSL